MVTPGETCGQLTRRQTRSIGTLVSDASIERIICGPIAYCSARHALPVGSAFRKLERVA